jgi:hypothetical protein
VAILISQAGQVTRGTPPAAPQFDDLYQATLWAGGTLLTRLFGDPQPFGGWLAYTPAGIALITPAEGALRGDAWDVTGAQATLGPVTRAIRKALGRLGERPRCGYPVHAYGEPEGTPPVPCGRPLLHPGRHRSPQALARYSRRAAERRHRAARDADRIPATSSQGATQ